MSLTSDALNAGRREPVAGGRGDTVAGRGEFLFEIDSLKLVGGDRLELSGRWFGVRGRRFMRPTLTPVGSSDRARVLADLEHKPWSAEDGEPWQAAFPYELGGEEVLEFELAVAPDIAVMLPAPRELGGGTSGAPGGRRGTGAKRRPALRSPQRPPAELLMLRKEADALRSALEEEKRLRQKLEQELERAAVADAELSAALARRDAAVAKLDAVLAERDDAIAGRELADAARSEADAARRVAERRSDEALAARRDADVARLEAERQRDQARAEAEAAGAERDPVPQATPTQSPSFLEPALPRSHQPAPNWLLRGIALAVLLAALVALAIVLQSA